MRFIFMDEAGTSSQEPYRVVVGVIVEADEQLRKFESEVEKVLDDLVPQEFREGFRFHATELFSGGKNVDRKRWPKEDRWDLIKAVASLSYAFNAPLAVSAASASDDPFEKFSSVPGLRNMTMDH